MRDPDWHVRLAAAAGLCRGNDPRAVTALAEALRDGHWCVRRAAAEALGAVGGAAAVAGLIEALSDEHWYVRCTAGAALERITGESLGRDGAAWRRWWQRNRPPSPAPVAGGRD